LTDTQPPGSALSLPPHPGIDTLLWHVPHGAERAERHLWLIQVLRWVREGHVQGTQHTQAAVAYMLAQCQARPELKQHTERLLARCLDDLHLSGLLADHGFAPRAAFMSELGERMRRRFLPASPDTRDLGHLFGLLFDERVDAPWLAQLSDAHLAQLADLLDSAWRLLERPGGWRLDAMAALSILAAHVRSSGLSAPLRLRLGDGPELAHSFGQIVHVTDQVIEQLTALHAPGERAPAETAATQERLLQEVRLLRGLLDACTQQAQGVHQHLEAHGVSVDVVFQVDQLRARCDRMAQLLNLLLSFSPQREVRTLLVGLIEEGEQRRSIRALFRQHYSLLARLVAERSAETGEHYITRDRAAYFDMLRRAAGGGLIIAGTTYAKFMLLALGLSAFWGGFAAGANYALSFVIIHLLHWTVATKQPAMTAPAMAAKLKDTHSEEGLAGFVDEAAHLLRSQVAGIVGNLAVVIPVVLAVQAAAWLLMGRPLLSVDKAHHVLHDLTLLGPTVFYAAFTGVLLFASSLVAGWVENWFVWHRLDSAMQWHPRMRAWFGTQGAERWAHWWRANISGLAANVSLGMILGLTPPLAAFFGLPIEVRHVTLSTGQIAAAVGTLGMEGLREPGLWWCVAAIPLTGFFNLAVSFTLALRVAIRSREVKVHDRARLARALLSALYRSPGRFLLPPRALAAQAAQGALPPSSP
jgi:site-specific recombinase